jgi:hypothetical protein
MLAKTLRALCSQPRMGTYRRRARKIPSQECLQRMLNCFLAIKFTHGGGECKQLTQCVMALVRSHDSLFNVESRAHINTIVGDFSAIPQIISHAFVHQMRINPPDHPVIVTEAPWNTPENRQRMAQIMFEEFKVPAFYIANNAVLSSYVYHSPFNQ